MKLKEIIVFSTEFKPAVGGLADYSYHLSRQLCKYNLLKTIITLTPQIKNLGLPIRISKMKNQRNLGKRWGDQQPAIRKFNTFFHYLTLYISACRDLLPFYLNRNKYLVLITSYYRYVPGLFIDACKKLNFEYAIVYHGLDIIWNKQENFKLLNRNSENASLLIFNSKATLELFKENLPDNKVDTLIIYPRLDLKILDNITLLSIGALEEKWHITLSDKIIITCITRLVKRKGVDTVIKALHTIKGKIPSALFLVAGTGEESVYLNDLIEQLNLKNHVKLLGYINDIEKFSLLKQSEIFVMPNKSLGGSDFEGFGISFIEASYFENVVIGGNHGGAREAILDGITGYNINAEQEFAEQAIASQLLHILSDSSRMKEMQLSGKIYVKQNFDWNNVFEEFLEDHPNL